MPSRRLCARITLVLLSLSFVACGSRKPSDRSLAQGQNTGCYDTLGDRVKRFFDGRIDAGEWNSTFDCVNDQVTFFRKYVRGSAEDGYNQADIAALVRKFLITRTTVSDAFIASIFDIKASVFGGSVDVITPTEIDEFLKLSEVLRNESSAILPTLQAKHRAPNGPNLLALSDKVTTFGTNLGAYLRTLHGSLDVKKESFLPFVRELLAMHGGDPTLVDKYGDFVRNLKVVVAGGSADVIEAITWPTLIREGAAFGGLLFAYRDMEEAPAQPGDRDEFQIQLMRRAQTAINQVIHLHGTGIPLEVFDPVIDTIPWDDLTDQKRAALKEDLRPIIATALRGGAPGWLTPAAVATAIDLFEKGMRNQVHLKRIYAGLPTNPDTETFEAAARDYMGAGLDAREKTEVKSLIEIAKTYIGLFPEGANQMLFTKKMRATRTENHMIRMSWFRLAIQHLFSVYATGPTAANGRKAAQRSDLIALSNDFLKILQEWKLSNPKMTAEDMATKRFREANLFMPTSNGDAYMDDVEGTYYLSFLVSSSGFSGDTFRGVTSNHPGWSACPIVGVDELGQDAVEAQCFRNVYFGHPEFFWKNFPGLQAAYAQLSPEARVELGVSMEKAARTGGYNENPIGPFDVDSFAALPHYVEDLVDRFDGNHDEILDKDEILKDAYPIFKDTLAKAAPKNVKGDFLLKGILTYLIRYGHAPKGAFDLLTWSAAMRLPTTKVVGDRASLYRIVAILSSPLEIDKNPNGSSWPNPNLFPTVDPR